MTKKEIANLANRLIYALMNCGDWEFTDLVCAAVAEAGWIDVNSIEESEDEID